VRRGIRCLFEHHAADLRRDLHLRKRWVTVHSLALPAFRLLRLVRVARVARLARAARSLRLARLWTAMLLTTMGSDHWPRTPEGRVLCLLLAIYAFAVFSYVTASITAYFVGKDQQAHAA
jgi:hypothetical protein